MELKWNDTCPKGSREDVGKLDRQVPSVLGDCGWRDGDALLVGIRLHYYPINEIVMQSAVAHKPRAWENGDPEYHHDTEKRRCDIKGFEDKRGSAC